MSLMVFEFQKHTYHKAIVCFFTVIFTFIYNRCSGRVQQLHVPPCWCPLIILMLLQDQSHCCDVTILQIRGAKES